MEEQDSESKYDANSSKMPKMESRDTSLKDESNKSENKELVNTKDMSNGNWESFDNNELLIYFSPHLEHQTKVIYQFLLQKTKIWTFMIINFTDSCL